MSATFVTNILTAETALAIVLFLVGCGLRSPHQKGAWKEEVSRLASGLAYAAGITATVTFVYLAQALPDGIRTGLTVVLTAVAVVVFVASNICIIYGFVCSADTWDEIQKEEE